MTKFATDFYYYVYPYHGNVAVCNGAGKILYVITPDHPGFKQVVRWIRRGNEDEATPKVLGLSASMSYIYKREDSYLHMGATE